jgi:hypothetical protein
VSILTTIDLFIIDFYSGKDGRTEQEIFLGTLLNCLTSALILTRTEVDK